jgi:Flp pilus assembly protein TadD
LARRNPADANVLANLAFALFDAGSFEAAEKTFLAAQAINPGHPLAHYGLGLIYRYSNRLTEARAQFRDFLAAENPQSVWYKEARTQIEQIDRLTR